MRCLSCQCAVDSRNARLWERRILMCPECAERGDKAKAELDVAHDRAYRSAMMLLEQQILRGSLLRMDGLALPGAGEEPPHA